MIRRTGRQPVVVQLSDPHVGAHWGPGEAAGRLAAAVAAVDALDVRPAAVLVSGDLADHGDDAEYRQAHDLLAALGAPLVVLPGNHDSRGGLRRRFGLPGSGDDPVQYAVALDGLRLVVLDSTRPGEDRGELDRERLAWLDDELRREPDLPTLLALHHPPVTTGVPAWDRDGLPAPDQRALAAVLERHPQVQRLVAGHLHRTIAADLAGRAVLTVPSTYVQGRLDLEAQELALVDEPAGFAVHTLSEGRLHSHLQPVLDGRSG